jgi:hypothetical protein
LGKMRCPRRRRLRTIRHYLSFQTLFFSQFKEQLKTHREQAKGGNTDWVNWVKCVGREILLEYLQPGRILFEKDNVSAEEMFQFYTTLPEVLGVVIGQFKARLKDHRKQANEKTRALHKDTLAFAHDRALYPRETSAVNWFLICHQPS